MSTRLLRQMDWRADVIPIYDLNIGRRRAGDDRSVQQSQNTRNPYDLHNEFLTHDCDCL